MTHMLAHVDNPSILFTPPLDTVQDWSGVVIAKVLPIQSFYFNYFWGRQSLIYPRLTSNSLSSQESCWSFNLYLNFWFYCSLYLLSTGIIVMHYHDCFMWCDGFTHARQALIKWPIFINQLCLLFRIFLLHFPLQILILAVKEWRKAHNTASPKHC